MVGGFYSPFPTNKYTAHMIMRMLCAHPAGRHVNEQLVHFSSPRQMFARPLYTYYCNQRCFVGCPCVFSVSFCIWPKAGEGGSFWVQRDPKFLKPTVLLTCKKLISIRAQLREAQSIDQSEI